MHYITSVVLYSLYYVALYHTITFMVFNASKYRKFEEDFEAKNYKKYV